MTLLVKIGAFEISIPTIHMETHTNATKDGDVVHICYSPNGDLTESGIYKLPEGMDIEEAQAVLATQDLSEIQAAMELDTLATVLYRATQSPNGIEEGLHDVLDEYVIDIINGNPEWVLSEALDVIASQRAVQMVVDFHNQDVEEVNTEEE